MNKFIDIGMVIYTNSVVYIMLQYGTPVVSFCTASLSLFYIIRKIKKEFYNKES